MRYVPRRALGPIEEKEIVRLYTTTDINTKELGRRFGISAPTVSSIIKRWGVPFRKHRSPSEIPAAPTWDQM